MWRVVLRRDATGITAVLRCAGHEAVGTSINTVPTRWVAFLVMETPAVKLSRKLNNRHDIHNILYW